MVTDKSGKIFDERRKSTRRKDVKKVSQERRTEVRRKSDK